MGTFWHKPAYVAADRDEAGEIRADALRPGIYCEDEAAFDQLRRGARVRSREMTPALDGAWLLNGQAVYLCTPEQAALFRATATVTPEESLAEQRAANEAALAKAAKAVEAMARSREKAAAESLQVDVIDPDGERDIWLSDRMRPKGMTGEEFGRRFMRHAPAGANRKARRAAAARARRGA